MPTRVSLPVLDAQIEARCRSIQEAHPYWPCAEGCDHCCRSLPHLPEFSRDEWARLRDAIVALPDAIREEIYSRTRESQSHPVVCPLLDRERGACRVYEARPIACRTYGFYADRDAGLHCDRVTRVVAERGVEETVVWGNGEGVAREVRTLGEPVSLRAWMKELDGR